MKKLLYDLASTQPSGSGKRHGGGKYGEEIFYEIVREGFPISCLIDSRKWINPEVENILSSKKIPTFDLTKEALPDIIRLNKIEVFYSPLPGEIYKKCDCKVIGTIHGMRAIELQYDKYMSLYKATSASEYLKFLIKRLFPIYGYKHAKKYFEELSEQKNFTFVMDTYHSRNALLSYFPQFKDKEIPVFYAPATNNLEISSKKYNQKYYLLVSANRWEKNNLRAIIALDRLISSGLICNIQVNITGLSSSEEIKYKIVNHDCFNFLGYVDEKELSQLYHDAYCLIYPSLNEGFGYPPLEAMKYGVPVIASPFTSISEICEGAVVYTNPLSIEEIMSRILLLEDLETYSKYKKLSLLQYNKILQRQNEDLKKLVNFIYNS